MLNFELKTYILHVNKIITTILKTKIMLFGEQFLNYVRDIYKKKLSQYEFFKIYR